MRKHVTIWIVALVISLLLGWLDHETTSWLVLLCNNGNFAALLIYMLIFAGIGYLMDFLIKIPLTKKKK